MHGQQNIKMLRIVYQDPALIDWL